MSDKKNYWTTKHPEGWATRAEGASRASGVSRTQSEAWERTKELARKSGGEAYLQGKNGQIRERNTYGYDPEKTKG